MTRALNLRAVLLPEISGLGALLANQLCDYIAEGVFDPGPATIQHFGRAGLAFQIVTRRTALLVDVCSSNVALLGTWSPLST